MNVTHKLNVINEESDYQKRLRLLVDNGFIEEASRLIWALARNNTVMCWSEWNDPDFCRPLTRISEGPTGHYIIISSNNKLDYSRHSKDAPGHWYVIFEFGWERNVLMWTEDQSEALVQVAMAHALARPVNQWSLKQAEGTVQISRKLSDRSGYMSWLITPLHLVFHMRQADFRHIYQYLVDVEGFSLKPESYDDVPAIVNWIVVKLERLGWSKWQISKELLEWIHLKSSTRPEWLLAVARSDVFASDGSDVPLAMAVRHWIKHHLGSIFDKELFGGDRGASIRAYKELFKIGQFGLEDKDWIEAELVERMALGRVGVVVFFVRHFGGLFGIKVGSDDTTLIVRAMHEAAKNGKYGVAVALARCCDRRPDQEWLEKVQLLQLPTSID